MGINGVVVVPLSQNRKIGAAAATYISQATCLETCSLKGNGCYAEMGYTHYTTARVNRSEQSIEMLAQSEADAIKSLSGRLPLRVHVVGDCPTNASARIVSDAMSLYENKFKAPAWAYTHAWQDVDRISWGNANVQASCENATEVALAQSRGYATAIIVESFPTSKLYIDTAGLNILPCPQQTGKSLDCISCGLCLNREAIEARHLKNISIGFAAHGVRKAKVIKALQ